MFPIKNRDDRLLKKELVHGIISGKIIDENASARVYVIDEFGSGINLVEDRFANKKYVIAGSTELKFANSFERLLDDGTLLEFNAIQNDLPVIIEDQEGNLWDIFGYAVKGPRTGIQLNIPSSYTCYWFTWAVFPSLEIYEE